MLRDRKRENASSDKAEYLVIFFHGYGSSGEMMEDYVGNLLGPKLPEATIRFPDGPIELGRDDEGHSYHSWFDIQDVLDAPDIDVVGPRAEAAAEDINAYIDRVMVEEGYDADHVILAGFSQGGTMAYYAGLLRDEPVAGVYSISGGALTKLDNPKVKPPVALIAGELEDSDYSGNRHALRTHKLLDDAGFRTECVLIPGKYHEISEESLDLLAHFTHIVTPDAPKNDNRQAKPSRKPGFKP